MVRDTESTNGQGERKRRGRGKDKDRIWQRETKIRRVTRVWESWGNLGVGENWD